MRRPGENPVPAPKEVTDAVALLRTSARDAGASRTLPAMDDVVAPVTKGKGQDSLLRRVARTRTAKGLVAAGSLVTIAACSTGTKDTGNDVFPQFPEITGPDGTKYYLVTDTNGDKKFEPDQGDKIVTADQLDAYLHAMAGSAPTVGPSTPDGTKTPGQTQDSFALAVEGIIGNVGLQVTDVNHNGLIDAGDTFKDATGHTVTITESQVSEAKQLIANTLGVGDRAKQGSSWDILNEGTQHLAVHLKDGDVVTRVNTDGMLVEGYFKVNKEGNPSETIVVNGKSVPQLDLIGGTFRTFAPDATLGHLWDQVNTKEHGPVDQGGQPGVLVTPVGFRPEGCSTGSTNITIRTAAEAAARFGTDDYTRNPANWDVTVYNDSVAFHLNPDASGLTHRVGELTGMFFEGYDDVADDGAYPFFPDGVRAISFVGNGSVVKAVDVRGGTFYAPIGQTSASQLNGRTYHLWGQHNNVENGPVNQGGQPGSLSLPYGFDPQNPNVC